MFELPITLYHNPRCAKSRAALALLEDRDLEPIIILYMETPPDKPTFQRLLGQLGLQSFRQLMRQKEPLYQELQLGDPTLSEEKLLQILIEHPVLIERPIVVCGERARIGRPAEEILAILPF